MNLIGKGGMSSRGTLLNVKNMFSHRTATPNDVMKSFNHCVDLLEVKYYTYILSCIMKNTTSHMHKQQSCNSTGKSI